MEGVGEGKGEESKGRGKKGREEEGPPLTFR